MKKYLFMLFLVGCGKEPEKTSDHIPEVVQDSPEKKLFIFNCSACHGLDPSKDGPIGPSLKGSSLELIRLRVTTGKYPKGYKPKRKTKMMPQFELTEEEIQKIEKYINE